MELAQLQNHWHILPIVPQPGVTGIGASGAMSAEVSRAGKTQGITSELGLSAAAPEGRTRAGVQAAWPQRMIDVSQV
jgi:hypothetical protein